MGDGMSSPQLISFPHSLAFLLTWSCCSYGTADGSFVETSSGQAARELKKRYDRLLKVNKELRSPYAITAFVNQHGKQMYRVGYVNTRFRSHELIVNSAPQAP
jgi:hypothetical protein